MNEESHHHSVKDVDSSTLKNNTTKDNISVIQKSRISKWVQRGDAVSADKTLSITSEHFGESVALNQKGTRLVVSAPAANPRTDIPDCDGKID